MDQVANPALWAQQGGLTGLVILALFLVLALFLKAQAKIYEMHRSDLRALLDLHARERESWGKIVDDRQRETNAAIQGVTAALNKISTRRRAIEDDAG